MAAEHKRISAATEPDRQSRRLIFSYKAACLLIIVTGLPWVPVFLWRHEWPIAAANILMVSMAAVSWMLIHAGRLNFALILSEVFMLAFTVVYVLTFDVPSGGVPRITHLYLLVLALLGYFNYLRRKSLLQLAVTGTCIVAFVFLASTSYAFPFAYPIADEVRVVGIWINSVLVTGMMCGGVYLIQREVKRPSALAIGLNRALRQQQLELHFQPQINRTGEIIGAEALLRWQHPKRGQIPPGAFIDAAEEAGMMPRLGGWVIAEACRTLARWSEDPVLSRLTLSVNVSASQFRDDGFEDFVLEALDMHGVDPRRIKLELTESVLVEGLAQTAARIEKLRAAGIGFSLDDFGTGYSSLSYLRQLPLDEIKVDRSFVREALESDRGAALVKSIVKLGLDLGFTIVAEGIETPDQHAYLEACGCHEFQGYLFGRPMQAQAFVAHAQNAALAAAAEADSAEMPRARPARRRVLVG
ncbi:putative bifunctional diguanylate cyclase/phosphodiesterase [Hoeflea olei]|uniref:EAL domain-containing protein n=1 Tax=Hoeflea olei TaxID=1480615 RepID=A0A1C1YQF3_9HYPH|nr:EAL domain-containing protein [Hoeflea olei]OCW55714.1 hypothetical protein AWJ14_14605 [Hoeflea olei]